MAEEIGKSEVKEKWYSLNGDSVCKKLQGDINGLSKEEVTRRQKKYGPNALPAKKPPTILKILFHQIASPLIYLLIVAGIVSLIVGEYIDAMFIFMVITLNTCLGAYQEYSAEKNAISLQNLIKIKARVRRDKKDREIDSEELVPGDIILLESGYKVPADLYLLQANNLTSDESFLTGESIAAEKKIAQLEGEVAIGDQKNISFAGSTIMSGRAVGIVVATGMETEVGKIAEKVVHTESAKPPLILRMEKFTKQISMAVVLMSVILAIILLQKGYTVSAMFFSIVALAVSAIPEGLPVALTVVLSIGTSRMAKRNVIVRKLTAVESLGSCTVIASDKTGTLTVNQQTAKEIRLPNEKIFSISGDGYNGDGSLSGINKEAVSEESLSLLKKMTEMSMAANEGYLAKGDEKWEFYGDAMDVAFIAMGYKIGTDFTEFNAENNILDRIPYESERKFSAAFYEKDRKIHVAAKGALEVILSLCDSMAGEDGSIAIDKRRIENQFEQMAKNGYRVIAVCGREYPEFQKKDDYEDEDLRGFVFHGLVGFIDPLRTDVLESVKKCKKAGVKVLMITGDHQLTAGVIAKELGITDNIENVITGLQLAELGAPDNPEFKKLVSSNTVFARISPSQKLEIADVLIKQGEFVAVTGDGVNDAPALRKANIGVAMGSGTDVAKDISSMIIIDDKFSSIVAGIEEGRFAYDNVRKVVYLLISTGAAEILLFFLSVIANLPLPLLAAQLLWLNLVTNGIQDIALAFEGGEPGAMEKKPRNPKEKMFNSQMVNQIIVSGLIMGGAAFALWYWLISVQKVDEFYARNIIMLLMVLFENMQAFNCRSEVTSVFKIPFSRNYLLIFGVFAAQIIHIASMHIPIMQWVLKIQPVQTGEWVICLGVSLTLLLGLEIFKSIKKRRN
ncbi:MAG: HAD-IC family P-type ATPase [Elusimicrobiota bacterium]|nr:HAD-IC family P-type ATPase [Elusimicrobiota bacterium]